MSEIKLPFNVPTTGNAVTDFGNVAKQVMKDGNIADSEVTALQGLLQQMGSVDQVKAMKALQGVDTELHSLVNNGWEAKR